MKHQFPQYLAEFIGTFFMVFFGCGAMILSQVQPDSISSFAIPLVFGGAVSVMIYSVGHISGAHFNPAVTLAFWAAKRFPLFRVPGYIIAQFLGAISASLVHKIIWSGLAHNFGITHFFISLEVALLLEVIFSFSLMFVIISVATDSRAVGELAGIAIGSTVAICSFVGGPLTGASMNPARTLGPAIVSGNTQGIWPYLVAPVVGAVLGALTYEWIRCHKEGSKEHGCC
jgi:aquaporin NIP